jgi:hypothetical protein
VEANETVDGGAVRRAFCSLSRRNGLIEAARISDDDDDRVIEMTGGGGLLVTLVIDFYVNDDNDDDKEPTIGVHTREPCCLLLTNYTHTRG